MRTANLSDLHTTRPAAPSARRLHAERPSWTVLLVAVAVSGLTACSSMSVTSTHDPAANFAGLRTYAWKAGEQRDLGDPRIDQPFLDAVTREAVEAELNDKGYGKSPAERADFLVDYDVVMENRSSSVGVSRGGGYRYGWSWWGASASLDSAYEQASLRLRVLEPQKSGVLWQSSADAVVDFQASEAKRTKRLRQAVARMLKGFPPK